MRLYRLPKTAFLTLSAFGFFVLAFFVTASVGVALWLAAASAYENVRLERTKLEMLSYIAMAQEEAKDPDFGRRPGEDLFVDLARRGLIPGFRGNTAVTLTNAWQRPIRLTATSPSVMRLETDVPAHACRGLALFFGQDARDVKLEAMEAREETSHWRSFFDSAAGKNTNYPDADAACGISEQTTLALMLQLR